MAAHLLSERPLPDAETQVLLALVTRRWQMVDISTAERQRLAVVPRVVQGAVSRRTLPG